MSNRWSIWIDVEGFSNCYKNNSSQAIRSLNELMSSLYRIGIYIFNEPPERLFIHQFGDGFIVVSDFPEREPSRPLAICIAIMRHLLKKGIATKAAISGGDWGDISSCYPSEVMKVAEERRFLRIGQGIMTIIPVMGMALIAAHKLSDTDTGALLLLDSSFFSSIPNEVIYTSGTASTIDWIHTELLDVSRICKKASLDNITTKEAEEFIKSYLNENSGILSNKWIERTQAVLSLECTP